MPIIKEIAFKSPLVSVKLKNGDREEWYWALLDTGAMGSCVSRKVAVDLRLNLLSPDVRTIEYYAGGVINASEVKVDIYFSDTFFFEQHKVAIIDIAPISIECNGEINTIPINVIIGMDIIEQCDFLINGAAHKFMLQKSEEETL